MGSNMADNFYLYLPSGGSTELYPTNTLAKYYTEIPADFTFNDDQFEVGLAEVILEGRAAIVADQKNIPPFNRDESTTNNKKKHSKRSLKEYMSKDEYLAHVMGGNASRPNSSLLPHTLSTNINEKKKKTIKQTQSLTPINQSSTSSSAEALNLVRQVEKAVYGDPTVSRNTTKTVNLLKKPRNVISKKRNKTIKVPVSYIQTCTTIDNENIYTTRSPYLKTNYHINSLNDVLKCETKVNKSDINTHERNDSSIDTHRPHGVDVFRGSVYQHSSLYIYTNICVPQAVGSQRLRILRILSLRGSSSVFDPIHYIPIENIHTPRILIDIRNSVGDAYPFPDGHIVVKLHFRRRT